MHNQNEIENSTIRVLLGSIPIPILGPVLAECFEFRGKIKQNRLNKFIELLENYFSNHAGVNLESFQTEEFGDLFESVLKRVVLTQSNEKMKMFKNIIVNQIEHSYQNIQDSEIYLELISELSEIEIKILFEYNEYGKKCSPVVKKMNEFEQKLSLLESSGDRSSSTYYSELLLFQNELGEKKKELRSLQSTIKEENFSITKDQFLFYKQRLFSKALLVDNGIGAIGGSPFQSMVITQFGTQFIEYVMAS